MGKITIFTSNDVNSKIVSKALENRELPYTEISIVEYPTKLNDVSALTGSMCIPKVFFNTRHVAGVDQIMKEFQRWDHSTTYKTPLEKYQAEITPLGDPNKKAFVMPSVEDRRMGYDVKLTFNDTKIPLMNDENNAAISFCEITEQIKFSVKMDDVQVAGKFYKKAFTGADVIESIEKSMTLSTEQANEFCDRLLKADVFHAIGAVSKNDDDKFDASAKKYYRLHCFQTPMILNSYHQRRTVSTCSPLPLVSYLTRIMNDIQRDCVDDSFLLDCTKCAIHPLYPMFEDIICELQMIKIFDLTPAELTAFALNVYKLMLAYAFIKVGVPLTEADRVHFLTHVKFEVDGCLFTFADWVDGILRSNKKGMDNSVPFGKDDHRLKLALPTFDKRCHFALTVGSVFGGHASSPYHEFTPEKLEQELEVTSKIFFEDSATFSFNARKGEIYITKALVSYQSDFSKNEADFISSLQEYMSGPVRSQVAKILLDKNVSILSAEVKWGRYMKNFQRYEKELLTADVKGIKALVRRFRPPKEAPRESERLDTLRKLKLLDTASEDRFDRITRKVQAELAIPVVFVTLVDQNRQFFKSAQWGPLGCPLNPAPSETTREVSICGHTILQNDILIVNDVLLDDRFADNPVISALNLRFYAGVPIGIPGEDGAVHNVATLCVIDYRPRDLLNSEIDILKSYAKDVKNELLRRPSQK